MTYANSKELCEQVARKTNGACLLAFSTGKDAICSWIELKNYFTSITPVYYYMIPGLSFVEKTLAYYEQVFETKIIRLPNPNLFRMLNSGTFQSPKTWKTIQDFQFPLVKREELCEYVKEDFGVDKAAYTAIGNRMYDNMARYRSISKFGAVNHNIKTFFPVYDFKIADVVKSIRGAGVKLPMDYKLWGKTFDGLDYRFIAPVKKHWPADYDKIRAFFPFIDAEVLRYERV